MSLPAPPPPDADRPSASKGVSLAKLGTAVFVVLLAVGALGFGVVSQVKAKVVIAGSVTLAYDPQAGKLTVAADPLGLVTKWVTVKVGDELAFTRDADKVTVLLTTATTKTSFQVPKNGSWSVQATDLAGPALGVDFDALAQQLRIDLSRVFVRTVTITRSDGVDGWDEQPQITKASTHDVTVDTSLLTTGDYEYCADAPNYCNLYLHAVATLSPAQRVVSDAGDPVSIPNGTRLEAICEAGGQAVRNDQGVTSTVWEYVVYQGYVGYVPAIWTGSHDKPVVRVCGA